MNLTDVLGVSPSHGFYDVKDQLKQHVYRRSERAFDAGDAARDAIRTRRQLVARQRWVRRTLIDALGGLPASDTPLRARTVGTIREDGFRIEKVIFESRPKVFVTSNLYVPDGITRRRGAVLFLCGHHMQAKHEPEYQIVCRYLVRAGLVVLAQDPVGQGERFSYYESSLGETTVDWGTREHDYAGSQCLTVGDGIGRYFLHDAMRGIDYLAGRPEADPQRIGVTGNSGGGTQTSLVMLGDPRIAAAAPTTFIMSRRSYLYTGQAQDAEQIWPGLSARGIDHEDILLAVAPKPVRVQAVAYDFFPIEGTRETVDRCKRFWAMCGRAGDLELVEDVSTHVYTRRLARSAAEFFSRHLLGRRVRVRDETVEAIEPSRLWCTKSGQVRGELAGARFVHEENVDRLREATRLRRRTSKAGKVRWLKGKVFANRGPCRPNLRIYHTSALADVGIEHGLWFTQSDLCNYGMLLRPMDRPGDLPVTVALWDDGTRVLADHFDWVRRETGTGRAVLVLDVAGMGDLEPQAWSHHHPRDFYGAIHKLSDDLIWLDDSLAALRVYDVLRCLDALATWPGVNVRDIRLHVRGRSSVYGRLAAVLDRRIRGVEVVEGPRGYADWVKARHYDCLDVISVVIPGILRRLDLPELR